LLFERFEDDERRCCCCCWDAEFAIVFNMAAVDVAIPIGPPLFAQIAFNVASVSLFDLLLFFVLLFAFSFLNNNQNITIFR
jgi:hypothetical protein